MTANYRKEGTVQYSGRAFHQDATDAMRGDIVRGLIELITNSDDAYAALDDNVVTARRTALHGELVL